MPALLMSALLLISAALAGCGTADEPPVRLPAALTITHPADGRPDQATDAEANDVCHRWGRSATLVERYENEKRHSKVSAFNCV